MILRYFLHIHRLTEIRVFDNHTCKPASILVITPKMEPHKVSILLLGDEKCGKSTFLTLVLPDLYLVNTMCLVQASQY